MSYFKGMASFLILLKEILRRFWKDNCMMSAQALTYNTVFALIPLLAFALSVVRFFVGTEEILTRLNDALSRFLNPGALSKAQETIFSLIQEAQRAPLGAASMILFLTMVVGLLMQFEEVLNSIFRVKTRRAFLQKITVYWMGLTLGPILVALPLGVTIYLAHLGLKGMGVVSFLLKFWTIPTIVLLFAGIYIYLPATKVKMLPAFIGATVSAILWVGVASLYAIYTSKAVAYSKLYGSLSAIPFFLLWLWVNWMVVLLGAEITAVTQEKTKIILHYKNAKNYCTLLLALGCLLKIYDRHHKGERAPNILALASEIQASPFKIEKILEILKERNLLYYYEDSYILAKDAENLPLIEIQKAIEGELPKEKPRNKFLEIPYKFLKKEEKLWTSITLKNLYKEIMEKDNAQVSQV